METSKSSHTCLERRGSGQARSVAWAQTDAASMRVVKLGRPALRRAVPVTLRQQRPKLMTMPNRSGRMKATDGENAGGKNKDGTSKDWRLVHDELQTKIQVVEKIFCR